ncbi:MAG TPA: two-component regulator propeller domain-containing protein [Alloacidobacterium sp.]|nr:two-component regulator propeller domain-containing protein [Alloacidobacterium sp.]
MLSLSESSICLDAEARSQGRVWWLLTILVIFGFAHQARAIDPNRAMSQYMRDSWGTENGFMGGQVNAIAQTSDGYLWVGAEKGLFRFDGRSFVDVRQLNPTLSHIPAVIGLTEDAAGDMWIRLSGTGVLRYHAGRFENVLSDSATPASNVTAMSKANKSGVLLSSLLRPAFRYSAGSVETLKFRNLPPNLLILALAETSDGKVWMGTRDNGLFYLSDGEAIAVAEGLPDKKINCLLPASDGKLWIGTDNGVARWDGNRIAEDSIPPSLGHPQVLMMTQDRDSNLWVGTAHGLLRLNARGVSTPDKQDHLFNKEITALFEDREGNLWAGTADGLERLRDGAFVTYSTAENLPSESNGPIYVDADDRTWFAPSNGGLYWMKNETIEHVTSGGIGSDIVYSLAGKEDELWAGRQRGGLTHLRRSGSSFTAETYTTEQGLAQNSVYSVHENRDGSVWAGTLSGGVSRLKDGKFTKYTSADGLGSNTVASIEEDPDGTMWFATPVGLTAFSKGQWQTYTQKDGLPSDDVICLVHDSQGVLWIGTASGLAAMSGNHISTSHEMPESMQEPIFGIAEDKSGYLWIATANHVLRVNRSHFLQDRLRGDDVHEYGRVDGLQGNAGVRRDRSVVKDALGRVWFSLNRGISVADPSQAKGNSAPAIAHIETVTADGSPIDLQGSLRIPSSQQRIVFDYTGLSLTVPDRVQYRYRLDGFDHDWSQPVATRQAIYTNLNPGPYRFRVIASNSYGQWNGSEATLSFRIQPALWQAWWFQCLCLLGLTCIGWIFYRLRIHQMARQLNIRFEERLAERTRIAQELHDTLLQGLLSASMQLHVAADQVSEDSPAKPLLSRVLQLMGQVVEEGRDALRGLRSSTRNASNLEQAFSHVPQELPVRREIAFRVIVDGQRRPLHPVIRDEVYRIGREALVNAFRHAQASSIDVEVQYSASALRILIRDDGCGIDPQVLRSGREGHWGLPGMRERAEGIGAKLKVWSRTAAGTDVELIVPGNVAYPHQSGSGWLAGLYPWKHKTEDSRVNDKNE